ncbi:MAG: 6-hydroxynicotinate 3-monooxygenase [Alphaproteobacteria bacterium]|nr:6-hydroxynicotinate 3-monooxygenase [Alphaproteobacteria bacterium]
MSQNAIHVDSGYGRRPASRRILAAMAPSLAIIGAGMGGLTLAAALHQRGIDAQIYEQAPSFVRLGAGIQMSPNAMRVLRGIGLEPRIRATAFQPHSWTNRDWNTGELTNELPLGVEAEAKYGAPYLLMHRSDLHEALVSRVPGDRIALGKKLTELDWRAGGVALRFADGTSARADAVIAADGIHSRVRELWLGTQRANFTGRVAYRTTFPATLLDGYTIDQCCKWWGLDRHIVVYYVTANRDEVYFVTSVPEPEFTVESWSATGDLAKLRGAFAGFHEQVQRVVNACPRVHKWAIVDRDPLPRWADGVMVLLGDAAHPMTQYMAQGAATAMEDAIVLSRCIADASGDMPVAFARFETARRERTAHIQGTSSQNTFMRQPTDPGWVYGYDAWTALLPEFA